MKSLIYVCNDELPVLLMKTTYKNIGGREEDISVYKLHNENDLSVLKRVVEVTEDAVLIFDLDTEPYDILNAFEIFGNTAIYIASASIFDKDLDKASADTRVSGYIVYPITDTRLKEIFEM